MARVRLLAREPKSCVTKRTADGLRQTQTQVNQFVLTDFFYFEKEQIPATRKKVCETLWPYCTAAESLRLCWIAETNSRVVRANNPWDTFLSPLFSLRSCYCLF